ncbi:MAG: hypothetical protein JO353_12595 [Phycisphaerae bacterium]|nr:hypothetical protein [Phycisphaerae bacterium]
MNFPHARFTFADLFVVGGQSTAQVGRRMWLRQGHKREGSGMAKSKHSAALFEVINPGQSLNRPLRRRNSWLGDALKSTTAQVVSAGSALKTTALARRNRPAAPKPANFDITSDPERQLINFKLTYTTAIVAGFAVLVAMVLAYAMGTKTTHTLTAATNSPSSAELRARGAHPDVLKVNDKPSYSRELIIPPSASAQLAAGKETIDSPTTAPSTDARVIGRQYVIAQTFADETSARAAKAFLEKNKIACSIENGLAGWAPKGKYCLVTTAGFDHIRGNSEFDKFETNIERLGKTYAESNRTRPFEPHAYRWKGD